VAKADQALRQAPGVLAVNVDYPSGRAAVGTPKGQDVPRRELLEALQSIGYSGTFHEP
jgi:hypothetical protein